MIKTFNLSHTFIPPMADLSALLAGTRPVVLGVLNVTPDSFSDGGKYFDPQKALTRVDQLLAEGADLVDIGGESTAPGSKPISVEEEWRRIAPCILNRRSPSPISVDTYKAAIAERALNAGVPLINDVSALRADPEMASVLASKNAFVILMHSKEAAHHPHASDSTCEYKDVIDEVVAFLLERASYAAKAGIKEQRIILDPGMGRFLSHDARYSWEVLRRFDELCEKLAPFPVCIATSRKGFLGGVLEERDPVSQLTALHAVECGAKLVRTHLPTMWNAFLRVSNEMRVAES